MGYRARKAFFYGVFGVLPDLDIFLRDYYVHRALLHNIFVSLAIPYLMLKLDKDVHYSRIIIACMIGFTFHMIADLIFGGVSLLYPIIPYVLLIIVKIGLGMNYEPLFSISFKTYSLQTFSESYIARPLEGCLFSPLSLLLLIIFAFITIADKKNFFQTSHAR